MSRPLLVVGAVAIFFFTRTLFHLHKAPNQDEPARNVIIIGGGVIGLSTAYYLASVPPRLRRSFGTVTILEQSDRICPASSSGATGGLGDFGFPAGVKPLGLLSYRLHQQLNEQYNGRAEYDFAPLNIHSVFADASSDSDLFHPDTGPIDEPLSALPHWARVSSKWSASLLANTSHASLLNSTKFCALLQRRCAEMGVRILFENAPQKAHLKANPTRLHGITARDARSNRDSFLSGSTLVIAAGPWSSRIYSQLLPQSPTLFTMDTKSTAGVHLWLKSPTTTVNSSLSLSDQVFFNGVIDGWRNLDLTSFPGDNLYAGGLAATPEELPATANEVVLRLADYEQMKRLAAKFLKVGSAQDIEIISRGRSYRPLSNFKRPIIARIDWQTMLPTDADELGSATESENSRGQALEGVFINTGHNTDGITLAPGSGLVMSELILGLPTSADITGLGLET